MDTKELNIEQAREIVRAMRAANMADPEFLKQIAVFDRQLEDGGWELEVTVNSHMVYRASRGRKELLRKPRREYQSVGAYVNKRNRNLFVHYYTNPTSSKRAALQLVVASRSNPL